MSYLLLDTSCYPLLLRICSAIWILLVSGLSTLAVMKASAFVSSTFRTVSTPVVLDWAGCCAGRGWGLLLASMYSVASTLGASYFFSSSWLRRGISASL